VKEEARRRGRDTVIPTYGGETMSVTDWSDDKVASLIKNYRDRQKTEGGVFSLKELLIEQMRRKQDQITPREAALKIIECAASNGGAVTYGELWKELWPSKPWLGNHSRSIVSDLLDTVIGYSADNQLPIISVLVVNASNRRLTPAAIKNIFEVCRELRVETGLVPEEFAEKQARLSRALTPSDLP
jgi:hypothetical protein